MALYRNGFSLVELSIVLVILGLLTGGILTGQNLIRAAELRSVTTQLTQYQTAVMTFRDRYFAIPGDMTNATDFWGSAGGDGTNATCWAALDDSKPVCNGNGDGYPGHYNPGNAVYVWSERMMAWKHLSNAGLVEGNYIGRTDSTSDSYILTSGVNVPSAKIGSAVWDIYGRPGVTGNANTFDDSSSITIGIRKSSTDGTSPLIPEELWGIDKKLDDGLPGYGKVRTLKNNFNDCATSDDAATAVYNVSDSSINCALMFYIF